MNPLLDVRHVSKSFGGVMANRDISLIVPEHAIVGLIGPNGSGKTTLFNSIVGHHPIDSGSITFAGREISQMRVGQIARLGIIRTFQHTRIYGRMTCFDNLLISASTANVGALALFRGLPRPIVDRAELLLQWVGLLEKRALLAASLSFGQQKLLELAMALMAEPKLVLLDEPTAGINPTLINDLLDRLRYANAQWGVTLLLIEHNMRVMTALAQRVYCLAHGELLADDSPERIVVDRRVIDSYLGAK